MRDGGRATTQSRQQADDGRYATSGLALSAGCHGCHAAGSVGERRTAYWSRCRVHANAVAGVCGGRPMRVQGKGSTTPRASACNDTLRAPARGAGDTPARPVDAAPQQPFLSLRTRKTPGKRASSRIGVSMTSRNPWTGIPSRTNAPVARDPSSGFPIDPRNDLALHSKNARR